jgi:His/Glu/Gln/Arg/opine family amino acid ABC transporter permease subunit
MSFDPQIIIDNWSFLARGLALTLLISLIAIPAGFLLGVAVALLRLRGGRVLRGIAILYLEINRNIPFLIQVFLLYFGLPFFGLKVDALTVGIAALASYAAAYFSEAVRGAVLTVPTGQGEAALALGLRYALVFRKVIFPQIIGYLIPASANLTITLIKESAALSIITVAELTYMAQYVLATTFAPVETFVTLAAIYWIVTSALARLFAIAEHRLQPYRAAASSVGASLSSTR